MLKKLLVTIAAAAVVYKVLKSQSQTQKNLLASARNNNGEGKVAPPIMPVAFRSLRNWNSDVRH